MNKLLLAVVAFFVGLLIGFVPQYFSNASAQRQMERTLEETRAQASAAEAGARRLRLGVGLAMLLVEAEEKNFGQAGERSTRFFDGLRDILAGEGGESARAQLQQILARRDEITAGLATANADVVTALRAMLRSYAANLQ